MELNDEQCSYARTIIKQAKQNDWRSKTHKNGTGGNLLTRGPIYYMLKNPVYAGLLRSGGKLYEGQHEPLISHDQWERVQKKLKKRTQRSGKTKHKASPLIGLLHWDAERLMPDHTTKSGKCYRYYVLRPDDQTPARIRLKADDVETVVSNTLSSWLATSQTVMNNIILPGGKTATLQNIKDGVCKLAAATKKNEPQTSLASWLHVINKIDLTETQIRILLHPKKLFNYPALSTVIRYEMTITSSCILTKRGHETLLILGEEVIPPKTDATLIDNLLLAYRLKMFRFDRSNQSWLAVLQKEQIDPSISHRFLRYAFLAPDIIEAILDGTAPVTMSSETLKTLAELPACWDAQRKLFGMTS